MSDRQQTFRVAIRQFGPFEAGIQQAWQSFAQAEGVELQLEAVALELHPLYETLFAAEGLKQGQWDVAFLPTDWLAQAFERGALLDLAPWLAADPPQDFPGGWTPSLLGYQQFDQVIIGLPYHDGPECLIYRTDLFDDPQEQAAFQAAYGRPLRVPYSWAEFQQVARFFHRPAQGLSGTIFAAYPDGHNTVYDFHLQLWTRGGESFDAAGRINLNSPAAIQALEFYRAMLNDDQAMHPQARQADSVKSGLAFAAGEVAMMVNWFGFASMAETIPESKVRARWRSPPYPVARAGTVSRSMSIGFWALGRVAPIQRSPTASCVTVLRPKWIKC
jgi:multiple sugar transport system substrate-binding protein